MLDRCSSLKIKFLPAHQTQSQRSISSARRFIHRYRALGSPRDRVTGARVIDTRHATRIIKHGTSHSCSCPAHTLNDDTRHTRRALSTRANRKQTTTRHRHRHRHYQSQKSADVLTVALPPSPSPPLHPLPLRVRVLGRALHTSFCKSSHDHG